MNLLRQLFLFVLLCMTVPLAAQSYNRDSLQEAWENTRLDDSLRLDAINKLAWEYKRFNSDSAIYLSKKAYNYALKVEDVYWQIHSSNSVGGVYLTRDETDSAKKYLLRAKSLVENTDYIDTKIVIRLNLGSLYKSTEELDKATKILNDIVDELSTLNIEKRNEHLSSAYYSLSNIARLKGDLESAYDYSLKTLKIRESDPSLQYKLPNAYNALGILCWQSGKQDEAEKYYLKSIKVCIALHDSLNLSNTYSNISLIYKARGDTAKAIDYLNKAAIIKEKEGNIKAQAKILINIASLISNEKNFRERHKLLEKAAEMARRDGYRSTLALALINDGFLYETEGNLSKARQLQEEALELSLETKNTRFQEVCYRKIAEIAYKLGDFKTAADNKELYYALKDSLREMAQVDEIAKLELEYEYQKMAIQDSIRLAKDQEIFQSTLKQKEAEIKEKEANEKSAKIMKYGLIVVLTLVFAFAVFIFNRFRLTSKQKAIIETQKQKVDQAYDELEEKNTEILDSINYAKRIQSAILPPDKLVKHYLNDSFIVYKPKDIVAGDFYWLEPTKDGVLFAAADCTGHGVPGAMVSVVCNNGLNRSVREHGLTDPGLILDKTRELIIAEFEKSEEDVKDGMDIALCSLSFAKVRNEKQSVSGSNDSTELITKDRSASAEATGDTQTVSDYPVLLRYAGAHNPLWIMRSGADDIEEMKALNQPIGKYAEPTNYPTHSVELNKGDTVYIFTDGYADQFGGEKGKKLKAKNFKSLLLSIQSESMEKQKELIDEAFQNWKGDFEQLDDVCVIGVRV